MSKSLILLISLGSVATVIGQPQKRWEVFSGVGKVIKHSPFFTENPGLEASYQIGFTFYNRKFSNDFWRQKSNYPEIGTTLLYTRFGKHETYGSAISLIPSLNIRLYSTPKTKLIFNIGTGISYLSRTFYNTNEKNRAIGSHWNNASNLAILFHHKLAFGSIFIDLGLTHFSNTAVRQPNLGLNLIRLNLGTSINLAKSKFQSENPKNLKNLEKWNALLKLQVGILDYEERQFDSSYSYAGVYSINLLSTYKTSAINRIISGLQFTYNDGRNCRNGPTTATVISLLIGDEITLGHFGYYGQLGYYLRQEYNPDLDFFTEFGINYYPSSSQAGFFVGIHIKNHLGTAEYPGLSGGYVF